MAAEIKQWEYRIQAIGSIFGTRDEQIEAAWTNGVWRAEKRSTHILLMEVAR